MVGKTIYYSSGLFFLLICELGWCSCSSKKKIQQVTYHNNDKALIAKVDFQKGFINDTLSLKINGNSIFNNMVVTSHVIVDFAQFVAYLYKRNDSGIAVLYEGLDNNGNKVAGILKKIKTDTHHITLAIKLNSTDSLYKIDFNKGKYLGFSKKTDLTLELIQLDRRFAYD